MKKALAILITAALSLTFLCIPVSALSPQDMREYGQIHFNIYSTSNPPVADGTVNPGEYGEPIAVINQGSPGVYWTGEGYTQEDLDKILPKDMTLYLTYDDNYLYLAVTLIDENHCTPLDDPPMDVWNGDYVEFDFSSNGNSTSFDEMRDRCRLAMGISNNGVVGFYSALWQSDMKNTTVGLNENSLDELANWGTITRNEATKLTTYEARIPWEYLTPDGKTPTKAFMYFQAGVGDSRYEDRWDYAPGAYLATWRWAAPISSVNSQYALEDEVGGAIVLHLMTFAGAPPAPIVEEAPAEVVTEAPAAETPAPTEAPAATPPLAPVTGNNFMPVLLVLAACALALAVLKKKAKAK